MLSSSLHCFPKGCSTYGGHATRTFNEMYSLTVQMFAWMYDSDKSKLMRMVMAQHSLSYLVNSKEEKFFKKCAFLEVMNFNNSRKENTF